MNQNHIDDLIENSISGTNADIAKIIYELYHEYYICTSIKDNIWYEYVDHKWKYSDSAYTLRYKISTNVANEFIKHEIYYRTEALQGNNIDACIKQADKLNKIVIQMKTCKFKNIIIKECRELFYDINFIDKLDKNPKLLGFNNGVYDLNTHQFRTGLPSDYLSISTNYDFDNDDDNEIQTYLMDFIKSIMKNDEMVLYILKVSAYMLDGEKYLEQLWFFTGNSRNAKSTYCNLLKNTFGYYYYEPDISIVTTVNKKGNVPELEKLKSKRILVSSEPDNEKDCKLKISSLKYFCGNLYKNCHEFKQQFGMIFQMNDKPELSKIDDAIFKSVKIINFPHQFVQNPILEYQKKIDTSIKSKFNYNIKYSQQMMRILLNIHKEYIYGNKYIDDPLEVKFESELYLEDNNPIKDWLNINYEITNSDLNRETVESVYNNYLLSNQHLVKRKFCELMKYLGVKIKAFNSTMYYIGIKFINNDEH